ncbi:MAG: 5'/3'-nucleotidase SurE [Gemmatales bacterium]|nr:5'/3'-nucleotidase SurE [Gemmatales bacterium]
MHILLTNDDGIYAPGLRALWQELRSLGRVSVVAPATEQSAVGHSITLLTPLIVQPVFDQDGTHFGWAVEGKPADCVKLALVELLDETPDLLVSGINAGSNVGINVLYSGTVAAAIEGAFFGITSIAVSLEYRDPVHLDFPEAARLARRLIIRLMEKYAGTGQLFNINIPSLDQGLPKGIRVVPQGTARYREQFQRRTDPRGRVYFWTMPELVPIETTPDTDVTALAEGYITITPLHFNLTDYNRLQSLQSELCD